MRAALLAGLKELDRGFIGLFERGRGTGEVGTDADPEALGLLASAVVHRPSVRARAGEERSELERLAKGSIATLLQAAT